MTMKLLNLKSIKRILFGYFDRLEKSATDSREKVFYLTSKIRKKRHYIPVSYTHLTLPTNREV